MSKKYSLITDREINDGLASGIFKKEHVGIIRNKDGHIVKHLKEQEVAESPIPSTLIQVHQNIIYQADLEPIINSIIKTNSALLFNELEEIFEIVLDKLRYYKSHKQRLDDLNSKTLEALSIFEKRLESYLADIETENLPASDSSRFFGAIDAYLNLIFIYLISTYWLHGSQLSNDRIVLAKTDNLKSKVSVVYRKLLIDGDINPESLANSVYAYLFIKGGDKIHLIDKFVKHDNRCKTPLDFFESFSDMCILKNGYNSTLYVKSPSSNNALDDRVALAEKLHQVMEAINRLENIYHELLSVGNLCLEDVEGVDNRANKNLQLTVIPLALHNLS